MLTYLAIALLSYLIGALPVAYLVVKLLTGRDLRRLGTGNVGVMNTVRHAGLPAGMLAFLGEGSKGIGALSVARVLAGTPEAYSLAGIMAFIGVNWPVFTGFHGGRGTTLAVFVAVVLMWQVVVVLGVLWLVMYRLRHDNFFATRVNIIALPFVTAMVVWATGASWAYVTLALAGALVALSRHRRETDDHYLAVAERVVDR